MATDDAPSEIPKLSVSHEGEHHNDFGGDIQITRSTYLFALCAALNSVNLGYDIGTSTSAGKLVQQDLALTMSQREIFVGSLNLWAMFGALGSNFVTDRYGRRRSFVVASILFIIGSIIQTTTGSYGLLMFGRVFVGLGVGFGLALDPIYIAEITPAKHRGELVTWSEISLNIGLVLGFSMKLITSNWRLMFLAGVIIPLLMIFLALKVMPESPRWLVANNQEESAKSILQRIYPENFDVDAVVNDIKDALQREQAAEQAVGWGVVLHPTPAFKRMLVVGVGLPIAQQIVGVEAIQYYLVDIIEDAGFDSSVKESLVLILIGIFKAFFVVIGGKLFDRRGRKPLLLVSLSGVALSLLIIALAYVINSKASKGFVIFAIIAYMTFFSIGIGPGAWLLASEVFATCIRAKAMSLATIGNRAAAFFMSSTFLSLANAMGWGAFFLFLMAICLMVIAFTYFFVPETKGRSLEDMTVYFAELTGDKSVLEAEAKIHKAVEMVGREEEPRSNTSSSEVL
ncbi:hypothetical protein FisN_6Hh122 [Fistulifera solaris]|uniref:Hexose transporter 1 n=1 Tax=Fistulifera solaris TaxID=1519565 RepID=A0A1Z5KHP4_FISSO|nr:hypothetical protein FisN_6Hh122 [Fistulifera solaris]|eukprot:GAX25840.1 hypothetical protein FisN_6Hh122 [Fistulifera solaris]